VLIEVLRREWSFGIWNARDHVVRWMAAFDTTEEDVDAFVAGIRAAAGALTG
jgi:threonine aldolase